MKFISKKTKKAGNKNRISVSASDIALPPYVPMFKALRNPTKYPADRLYKSRFLDGFYMEGKKSSYFPMQEIAASLRKAGATGYLVVAEKEAHKFELRGCSIDFPEEDAFYFYKNFPPAELEEAGKTVTLLLDSIVTSMGGTVTIMGSLDDETIRKVMPGITAFKRICDNASYLKALKRVSPIEKESVRRSRMFFVALLLTVSTIVGWSYGDRLIDQNNQKLDDIAAKLDAKIAQFRHQIEATEKEYNLISEIKSNKKGLK